MNLQSEICNLQLVWVANLRKSNYVDITVLDDLPEKNNFAE